MTRRTLLSVSPTLYGTLFLSRCASRPAPRKSPAVPPRFNVVFHGMAAYFMSDPIWVHLPTVPGQNEYSVSTKDVKLEKHRQYRVDLGVEGMPPNNPIPQLSPFEHIILRPASPDELILNPSQVHCSIQLPVPETIRYFRLIEKRAADDLIAPGETKRKYGISPYLFPSVYVFSYLTFGAQPRMVDDAGKPIWTRSGQENLLVYAEPSDCQTINRVYCLNDLFSPPLDLNYTQAIGADPPDDSGEGIHVSKSDLASLYENKQADNMCGQGGVAINYLPILVYPLPQASLRRPSVSGSS